MAKEWIVPDADLGCDGAYFDYQDLVRCKDCKYGIVGHGIADDWVLCSKPYVTDTVGNMMHRRDWFCADGRVKDDGRKS